jgi:hypothetical protein
VAVTELTEATFELTTRKVSCPVRLARQPIAKLPSAAAAALTTVTHEPVLSRS